MAVTGRSFPSHRITFPQTAQLAGNVSSNNPTSAPASLAAGSVPGPVITITVLPPAPTATEAVTAPTLPLSNNAITAPPASASASAGSGGSLDTFTRTNAANWDGPWIDAGFSGTGWTFSEDGSKGHAVPAALPPALITAGFNSGAVTDGGWTGRGTTGALFLVASPAWEGAGSLQAIESTSPAVDTVFYGPGPNTHVLVYRFYLYLARLLASGNYAIWEATFGSFLSEMLVTPAGQLVVCVSVNQCATLTGAMTPGQWYLIDGKFDYSTGTWLHTARLSQPDGTQISEAVSSFSGGSAQSITQFSFGKFTSAPTTYRDAFRLQTGGYPIGPAARTQARLLQDTLGDADWYADVHFSSIAAGDFQEAGLIARFATIASHIRLSIRQAAGGVATLRLESARSGGITIATFTMAGADPVANTYRIHLQMTGTTANASAWNVSGSEPNAWQLSATLNALDPLSGASGGRVSVAAGNTNLPNISFDNYQTLTGTASATPVITMLPGGSSGTASTPVATLIESILSPIGAASASALLPLKTIALQSPAATANASSNIDSPFTPGAAVAAASVPVPIVSLIVRPGASGSAASVPTLVLSLVLLPGAATATELILVPLVGQIVVAPVSAATGTTSVPIPAIITTVGTVFSPGSFDLFNRLLNNTWGNASTGELWTIQPTLDPSPLLLSSPSLTPGSGDTIAVNGTQGVVTQAESINSFLASINDLRFDSDVSIDANWTTTPTGDWNQVGVVLRLVDNQNYLLAGLRKNADGTAQLRIDRMISGSFSSISSLPTSFFLSSNTYTIKARVQGSSMLAKFWLAGTDEPAWQLQGSLLLTDPVSGSGGVFFLPSSAATDVQTITYDNFAAFYPSMAQAEAVAPAVVTAYPPASAPIGTASVPDPSLTITTIVQAIASASALLPVWVSTLVPPTSSASQSVPTPVITGVSSTPVAAASGSVPAPSLTIMALPDASTATASSSALLKISISVPRASASARSFAPVISLTIPVGIASASASVPAMTFAIKLSVPPVTATVNVPVASFGATTLILSVPASARAHASGRNLNPKRFIGWAANPAPPEIIPIDNGTSNVIALSFLVTFHVAPIPTGVYLAVQAAHSHGERTYVFNGSSWQPATYDFILPDDAIQKLPFAISDEARLGVISQGGESYFTAGFSEQTPILSAKQIVRNQTYRIDTRANCESGIWTIDWMVDSVPQRQATTLRRKEAFVFDRTPSQWRQTVLASDAFPTYNDFELTGFTSNLALTPYPFN